MSNPNPNTSGIEATKWKPGQSGNPGGRRKRVLSDRYAELMETVLPEEIRKAMKLAPGALWGDALAQVSARTALKSTEVGVSQRKEIREAIEGKAPMRFEVRAADEVEFVVVFDEPLKRVEEKRVIDVKAEPPPSETVEDDESS